MVVSCIQVWHDVKTGISSIICLFSILKGVFKSTGGNVYVLAKIQGFGKKIISQKILKLMPSKFNIGLL